MEARQSIPDLDERRDARRAALPQRPRQLHDAAHDRLPPLAPGLRIAAPVLAICAGAAALWLGLRVRPLGAADVVRAIATALAIVLPVLVGLFASGREQTTRFARLLLVGGLIWAPSALALSSNSVAYSVGRTWGWGLVIWIAYLILAFPLGRLTSAVDRWFLRLAVVTLGLLYLPTVLFTEFPVASPWSGCDHACPDNAFVISSSEPGVIGSLVGVRGVVTPVLYLGAATSLAFRWRRGSAATRHVHGPVFALGLANLLLASVFLIIRGTVGPAVVAEWVGLLWLVTTPGLVLAFLAGLIRWRLAARGTRRQLAPETHGAEAARGVRDVIAAAIRDPSLESGYWDRGRGRWIDDDGLPFALPAAGSVRELTEVTAHGELVALLVHESSDLAEPAIREVVQGVAIMALVNQGIEAAARARLRELSRSRARIVEAIDRDRLRIERNLHDGAQQRLIALKIAADRGAMLADEGDPRAGDVLRRIAFEAGAALDDVRSLARGVFPPLLGDHGIVEALRDTGNRSPLRVTVHARGVGRYPQEVEAAVYFSCLEALQNAEKHASARSVSITLSANGEIIFEVRDDGRGFAPEAAQQGTGLTNMRDRVTALGGSLRVESVLGGGTLIAGRLPAQPQHVPVEIERLVLRVTDELEDALGIYRAVRTASGEIVDFAVEHVNDTACAVLGLARDAQVGKTVGQLQPEFVRSPLFYWLCDALEASEPMAREDIEYVGEAGARRIQVAYETRAVAVGAGRLALLWRDITDRKRVQRELELRSKALAGEGAAVCIVRAATTGILYANREFERMLGYSYGELEGRAATDFDVDARRAARFVTLGSGNEAANVFETRLRRSDGSIIWCEVTLEGFEDPDLGWCWVAVHREVTAVREHAVAIAQRREHLERALKGLPVLAYTTDPELRPTLLFDSLLQPGQQEPRSGSNEELFGTDLAGHVADLNQRALVTRRPATAEVEVDLGGPARVALNVDPILTPDGGVAGLVGTVLRRTGPPRGATVRKLGGPRDDLPRRAPRR
jgi:PAS domain S-box-containing protein